MNFMYTTIIQCPELYKHLHDTDFVIVDCRYDLMDVKAGARAYEQAHINGAVFADVHDDLSGPPVTDRGRHPLPTADALKDLFSRLGVTDSTQVVIYDASGGAFAGRLWWLLRYMGHQTVAVLDGGWQAWLEAGYETASGVETNPPTKFKGQAKRQWLVTVDEVEQAKLLVDSRDPARYRGEVEPIDKAAGHIPGAINHFWQDNLDDRGCMKKPEILRNQFLELLGGVPATEAVFYCGSGVTACQNLLAMAYAGLATARLYAGSWSEWSSDPARPVATSQT